MKYIGILAVILLVIGGFVYYMLFAAPIPQGVDPALERSEQTDQTTDRREGDASEPRQGVGTLTELRLLGERLECTIGYEDKETESVVEGTYFVSDGDMRGDFLTESPDLDGQILSSMIITQDTMYIWSEIEGQQYGMRIDTSLVDDLPVESNEPIDLDEQVTYDCKPWRDVDRTIFEPPSTVLFQDMSDLLRGGMEYGTTYDEEMLPVFPN